jgi:uncharacterized phage-associated protein
LDEEEELKSQSCHNPNKAFLKKTSFLLQNQTFFSLQNLNKCYLTKKEINMLEFHYNLEKVLESISYLLSKTKNKELDILHLIKFLYFADRESIKEYNYPITGDSYSSLPYGPIVSKTFDLIKSNQLSMSPFSEFIKRDDKKILLTKERAPQKLSEADLEILDQVYHKFIHYTPAQLIDYCHNAKFVPEWKDPGSSSIPIDTEDLLLLLGKSQDEIKAIRQMIQESEITNSFLSKYEA